ncbi:protein BASIC PENTACYSTEINE6-like [Impatiens glandulifera]|uniref:protein BASIC PENTACYSTEINE6-like n=1 Tax=Impatiens glandulifera TaxID=253017 RepID=UPI001FB082BC|nr:protein BASIC PENTACYSTEINE6-like [Impatiens glandulifera]
MMENNFSLKTYMSVMAERDAAIREKNVAMEERRQALAERDLAMTQRDSALAERNTALEERDKALNALDFCESPRNEYNLNPDSQEAGVGVSQELEYMYNEDLAEAHKTKTRKGGGGGKQRKEKGAGAGAGAGAGLKKKGRKRGCEEMTNQVNTTESTASDIWDSVDFGDEDGDELEQHFAAWNQNSMGLKEEEEGISYDDHDESALPPVPPICSCSGVSQPCYKLGNGGWQSACCTTNNNMPMYHLQHLHQSNNNKRSGVVVGRKISGSALSKLITRLVAEELHDPSMPLDLKDHWDQHETIP